jgi:Glycosyltransferase family 92
VISRFLEYADRARANPHFDLEERDHRVDVAQRIRGMLDAVREGALLFEPGTRTVFRGQFGGRPYALTGNAANRWLHAWAKEDEASLEQGLLAFTEPDAGPEERFDAFARAAEQAQSAGTIETDDDALLALGSLFNFAVEPEALPIVDPELFARLERTLAEEPPSGATVPDLYRHHLAVTGRFAEAMEDHGIPTRDMIDVQSLIWIAAEGHELWAAAPPTDAVPAAEANGATASAAVPPDYLAVCGVYRDEAPYLREWIEFHRLVGVQRFFLYDNKSTDDHLEVLQPYVEEGIVVLHDWPHFPAGQHSAFEHCLQAHRDDARWIAFIDLDEFLFSPTDEPVSEVLRDFEQWPGVGVNSVFFGTSGHRTRPAGLVIENYLQNDAGEGKLAIKSIVDPRRTVGCPSVHHFTYTQGMAANENGYPIKAQFTKSVSHSLLRINHYWAKSEEQFRAKCATPGPGKGFFRPWYDMRRLGGGQLNELSYAILKYAPALREAMGAGASPAGRNRPPAVPR